MHWTPDCTRVYRPQTSVNSGASIAEQQEEAAYILLGHSWNNKGARISAAHRCARCGCPARPRPMSVLARDPR